MLFLVFQESVVDAFRHEVLPVGAIEELFLIGGGNESQLYQATRHRGLPEHEEPRLVYPLVYPSTYGTHLALDEFGQVYTLSHVLVLHEFEHDITLRRLRVEAGIALLIVFFDKDDRILALGHIEVVVGSMHTERIGFEPTRDLTTVERIGMNRDKQVGLVSVGDVGPFAQGNEDICRPGVDDFHVLAVSLHHFAESQRHLQVDVLLFGDGTWGTRVVAAMTSIDDERKLICRQGSSDGE